MMKNCTLSDSFDNLGFSFSESERISNPNTNYNIKLQGNENRGNIALSSCKYVDTTLENSFKSSHNVVVKESSVNDCDKLIKDSETVSSPNNISIDDSIFLNVLQDDSISNVDSFYGSVQETKENENQDILHSSNKLSIINKCQLLLWGLPDQIVQKYKNRGITEMFAWQAECLSNPKLLENNANLVYSAPTSAGKTLVAEILAIKTVVERAKKVLFILPFVSVVREKMFYFQDILGSSGIRVEGFMGSHHPPGKFQSVQVAICTIEKANGIINRLLEENALDDIGLVVIDEMHLLGDSSRGYLLELMLTKLLYMKIRFENINIQIVGMSATLPNLDLLGRWLKAELYVTNFRPIPLYEQCHVNGEIYTKSLVLDRHLAKLPELETDTDNILQLCLETIAHSCSVLIFCPTKNWCENLAQQIAVAFWKLGCSKASFGSMLRQQLKRELISELLEQLTRCPVGLDKVLQKSVSYGVAFHHAGLTMDERDIIEAAFRNGGLRVLVATSTLSSGVNLPARRVIIRTPLFHGKPIDILVYQQMIGRAGRMGKDSCGESILICQKNDYSIAKKLLSADLQPIESCLEGCGKLKRAILEVIASGVAATPEDVELFTDCTLLATSENKNINFLKSPVKEAVDFLIENEFIRLQQLDNGNFKYIATPLGKACLSSSLPPEEGLTLFAELQKARQCFVLETELHLIYLVTPYSVCNQWGNLDWLLFLELWEKLSLNMKRVGNLVGVRESYIVNGSRNKIQTNTAESYQKLQIHKRFFTALALQDLVNEVPLNDVAMKFGCCRGMLQSLQQSASTFAGMLTIFSRQLGWTSVEILISQFQDRLQFGVNRDLLDLMRLPILNGPRARALYNAGIETLVHLASSDILIVENVLHKVAPFESEKERDGESEFDTIKRNKTRGIWVTGKEGVTEHEAAIMLVQDARRYLQCELGLAEAKWEENTSKKMIGTSSGKIFSDEQENSKIETGSQDEKLNRSGQEEVANNANVKLQEESSVNLLSHIQNNITTNDSIDEKVLNNTSEEMFNLSNNVNINLNTDKLNQSVSDQSLFEESFEVNKSVENNIKSGKPEDNLSTNGNSGDSGLDFDNVSFLENAFVSNFSLDASVPEISPKQKSLVCSEQSQVVDCSLPDLIEDSQHGSLRSSITSFSPFNGRKRPRNTNYNRTSIVDDTQCVEFEHTSFKKQRTSYDVSNIVDLSKIEIINVCLNKKLYLTFINELFEQSNISISFACKKINPNKQIIGGNILNKRNFKDALQNFSHKYTQVAGIALSWGSNVVYYISLEDTTIISNCSKIETLQNLFAGKKCMRMFDSKEQIKIGKLCCGIDFSCVIEDPKVADWLMNPEGRERNLQAMAVTYAPEVVRLSQLAGHCKGVGSVGLDGNSPVEAHLRAGIEAVATWYLCESVPDVLAEQNVMLLQTYKTEMSSILCLARMELNGLGVNIAELQSLADNLQNHVNNLEKQAFALAGRRFSFTSSTDVAKILGMYRGRKVSTDKQMLEKQTHPIANIIVQWRKLNCTLTRMVSPLICATVNGRIHGCCLTYNCTGRISMHEPNLQNVPKDFEIEEGLGNTKSSISCRAAFVPKKNCVFLSADYCQLELRLLAHFSQDPSLCSIMKSDKDIFRSIAAKWRGVDDKDVDEVMRQWAKELCYGIIYGMGAKTLAEKLSVSETEAHRFMETFNNKYPFIRKYIEETIAKCEDLGYVETLAGRRRCLPNIAHLNSALKSQARRQAVNTTVQGSAADLAKLAMVLLEERFRHKFRNPKNLPVLVLHLHDELLYEVQEKYLYKTAKILKQSMEEAVKLSVPFPVKLKSGLSWGILKEFVL